MTLITRVESTDRTWAEGHGASYPCHLLLSKQQGGLLLLLLLLLFEQQLELIIMTGLIFLMQLEPILLPDLIFLTEFIDGLGFIGPRRLIDVMIE